MVRKCIIGMVAVVGTAAFAQEQGQGRYDDGTFAEGYFYLSSDGAADLYLHDEAISNEVEDNPRVWMMSVEPDAEANALVKEIYQFELDCKNPAFRMTHMRVEYMGKTTSEERDDRFVQAAPGTVIREIINYTCPSRRAAM